MNHRVHGMAGYTHGYYFTSAVLTDCGKMRNCGIKMRNANRVRVRVTVSQGLGLESLLGLGLGSKLGLFFGSSSGVTPRKFT